VVGAQTADSPIRHTPVGKEVIRLLHCNDHELKNFLSLQMLTLEA